MSMMEFHSENREVDSYLSRSESSDSTDGLDKNLNNKIQNTKDQSYEKYEKLKPQKSILNFSDNRYIVFFSIIAAILSFIETFLPKPLLFVKVGFAYVPILLILGKAQLKGIISIILLKSILGSIFAGTLFSFTFLLSLSGNIGVIIGILILSIIPIGFSRIAISIFLSSLSNIAQLFFYSFFIIRDMSLLNISPLIICFSVISGFFTGLIAVNIEKYYLDIRFDLV